ncbi:MAG: hypothetical protein ABI547_06325 [Betaproteobacteria bacterium]
MIAARTVPLLCLLAIANAASAAELGRMFYTPAQRATLDNARKQNFRAEIGNENEQQPAAAPVPQSVSVNGVIRRSDGKNTIWLNNRVVNEQQPGNLNAAIGKADNRVRLNVPESGRNLDLKVGQTVEIVSGTIEESYLRRPAAKTDVKPPPEGEKTGGDVAKVIATPPREALKSDSALQRRPVRAVDNDIRDEAKTDSGLDKK